MCAAAPRTDKNWVRTSFLKFPGEVAVFTVETHVADLTFFAPVRAVLGSVRLLLLRATEERRLLQEKITQSSEQELADAAAAAEERRRQRAAAVGGL